MNFIKRGILYLIRKRSRTVLLLLVMSIVSSLLLVSSAIWNSTNTTMENLRSTMGGYFKMEANTEQGYRNHVTDDLVEQIMKNDEIKAFNGNDIIYALAEDMELEPGRFTMEGDEKAGLVRVIGTTASEYNEYFALKWMVLCEGRALMPGDSNKVLISENIAKKNGLTVGDMFTIRLYDGQESEDQKKKTVPHVAEVAGIYRIEGNRKEKDVQTAECDMEENFVFAGTNDIRKMMGEIQGKEIDAYAYGVTFYVADPGKLDNIVEEIRQNLNVDGEKYIFTKNNKTYEESAAVLGRLNGMMVSVILLFFAVGSIILSLMLIFMMRERFHEIGIFTSMGYKKSEIIGQHMFENIIVALAAFGIAWILVSSSAAVIEHAVKNAIQMTEPEREVQVSAETPEESVPENTDINIRIGESELAEILGLELLLVLISTGISSAFVIKMKPRSVLSLMS